MGAFISRDCEVAVIGAGPYGLSVAAHLRARGADVRIFGEPMSSWRERMPKGMLLKSDGFASNLSAPGGGFTLREHCSEHGVHYHHTDRPVALETLVDYGLAFQKRYVPDVEPRQVTLVTPSGLDYRIELDDGEVFTARQVVLAVGITHFGVTPETFADLGPELVSHSSAHHDLSGFKGRDVTVVGAGSSAVDLAVGLAEAGATARVVARAPSIKFGTRPPSGGRGAWDRIRHPQSGLGPGLRSMLACEAPDLFRLLPGGLRLEIARRHLGPFAAWHIRGRFEGKVQSMTGRTVERAEASGGRVRLTLGGTSAGTLETDHVVCATGYRADVDRLGFLDPNLRAGVRRVGAAPVLSPGFESSARGLYFTGLAASATFGPLMRFIYGADFAAKRIVGRLAGARR